MSLLINLLISISCALCKWIGERFWHDAERFIIPPILVFGIWYHTHIWWLGLPSLLMIGDLVEGYGVNSWMRKLLGDSGAQGMWMFGACFLAGIIPQCTGRLPWHWGFFMGWCVLAGVIGATLRGEDNNWVAPLKGIWMSMLIWFIH